MAEIEFDDVTKRYDDGFEAVKRFTLTIRDGELMCFVGPSGSGKSTVLRMVAGLEDVSEGELRIDGRVVNDLAPRDRDIAMVFQNYALYPHMTVRQNMGFALELAKHPRQEIESRVTEAARVLDIEDQLDRKPANLSGGQRQRVAMGRAIVRNPKVFLMDEPLSNLDAKLRVQTRTEVARIQQRFDTTTIYVTHDQVEALTLGDRITVMRLGELQQVGTPLELYSRPVNLFVAGFIGSPSMNFLPGTIEEGQLVLPIGKVPLPDEMRRALEASPLTAGRQVVAGLRPEHFEDAALIAPDQDGVRFVARIDVLESLGSESYAHFGVESERVTARDLEELAEDAGAPRQTSDGRVRTVARLSADSGVRQGEPIELWFDPRVVHVFDPESGRNLTALERAPAAARA